MKACQILVAAFLFGAFSIRCVPGASSGEGKAPMPAAAAIVNEEDEKEAVKKAALAFFKWHDAVWVATGNKREKTVGSLLLDKRNKPSATLDEWAVDCPCRLNETALAGYVKWVKAAAPHFSQKFIDSTVGEMRKAVEELNAAKKNEAAGSVESFVINGMFYAIAGQDHPSLVQSEIFTAKTKWNIETAPGTDAVVTVDFKTGKDWGHRMMRYTFPMTKEKSGWKLAGPLVSVDDESR